ncbi:sn-glycerol-3-phosphate ABC transporter ATP-binding protein UgpC [Clostridium sp. KNHs214]|uniref:ABC transporter ATP-binding protein n=1 Tax=Clostridium sp. KNHs214 TaxID=1540257 RepID=UPI000555B4CD|nr:sn-glycerol-3-phosphate ABC transporter ATP-binding protein UgpC [Clostridium sp. KNHs214]
MSGLKLTNINKKYKNGVHAVKDVNLDIKDKEFVVLVGPSGCGKSTILRMIAGLEEITSGELSIGNKVVNEIDAKDRDIAMVFQNYALYPHMTVYENMAFGLKMRKIPKDEIKERVNNVAEILGIQEFLRRKPKQLSGGQRQRVALGRAIVREPKVFLMDEPLSNLDAKLRVQTRSEITKLHKALNTTFVYVTHDQTEAMTMGTRIVVMKDGIIQQVDTPQNIYDKPNNVFVASFIGSPQMNFMEGTLKEVDGYIYIVLNEDSIILNNELSNKVREKAYIGKKCILGVRPEHITIASNICDDNLSVGGKVHVVEHLGAENYVHVDTPNGSIVLRTPSHQQISAENEVKLFIHKENIYLFDKETEENIN